MPPFTFHLQTRTFTPAALPAGLRLAVQRLSWRAVGGPDQAVIAADGPRAALWELAERLRCPLTLHDGAQPVWWGYIDSLCVQDGAVETRAGLDGMANRVRVRYGGQPGSPGGAGAALESAFLDDAESQAVYGIKEAVGSIGPASAAEAEARRARLLAERRWPPTRVNMLDRPAEPARAVLGCRGWWHSLAWRAWRQPAGWEEQLLGGQATWLGAQADGSQLAQRVRLPAGADGWWAERVRLRVKTIGGPQDDLLVELRADAAGAPGAVLAAGSLRGAALGVSSCFQAAWVDLAPRVPLPGGRCLADPAPLRRQ